MLPVLEHPEAAEPRTFFFQYRKYAAVRHANYKLLRTNPDKPFMLFDLDQDLSETTDLADQKPKIAKQMKAAYAAWEQRVQAE
jgi:arylsulfatase A-like enzyme